MAKTPPKDLTPKQSEVLALLHQGLKPKDVAERMGFKASTNVYGHMKQIRLKGHTIPAESMNGIGAAEPVAPTRSQAAEITEPAEPVAMSTEQHIEREIARAQDSLGELEAQIRDNEALIAQAQESKALTIARIEKLDAARTALQ